MGLPLARRLLTVADVVGFDVDPARRAAAAEHGVRVAARPDAAAAGADVVLLVLPGAHAQRTALRRHGLLDSVTPGSLVAELTSGDPDLSDELHRACESRGAGFVSAPMAGGPRDADAGTLGFFVAGEPAQVARMRPLLDVLARPGGVQHVGEAPRQAQQMKLIVNALWFGQATLVTEGLLLAARAGIDADRADRILNGSAAASAFIRDYVPRLRAGDYVGSFGIGAVLEELDTVVEQATAFGTPADALRLVRALHAQAREAFGDVDGELLVSRLLEDRAGLRLSD
jgi:3-hydroxyisobutyrate dehydrogenase